MGKTNRVGLASTANRSAIGVPKVGELIVSSGDEGRISGRLKAISRLVAFCRGKRHIVPMPVFVARCALPVRKKKKPAVRPVGVLYKLV